MSIDQPPPQWRPDAKPNNAGVDRPRTNGTVHRLLNPTPDLPPDPDPGHPPQRLLFLPPLGRIISGRGASNWIAEKLAALETLFVPDASALTYAGSPMERPRTRC